MIQLAFDKSMIAKLTNIQKGDLGAIDLHVFADDRYLGGGYNTLEPTTKYFPVEEQIFVATDISRPLYWYMKDNVDLNVTYNNNLHKYPWQYKDQLKKNCKKDVYTE
jgi:hypothetical protein